MTPTERRLYECLRAAGGFVHHDALLEAIGLASPYPRVYRSARDVLRCHISHLRDALPAGEEIVVSKGLGYWLRPVGPRALGERGHRWGQRTRGAA